jgi:hypothetical protein
VKGIGLSYHLRLRRDELDGTDMGDHLCSENQKHFDYQFQKTGRLT